MKRKLAISLMALAFVFLIWTNMTDSFFARIPPQFTFVLGAPTTDDIFILTGPASDIVISSIEGILLSGNSVTITLQKCDFNGANCSNIESGLIFDGNLDTYTSIDDPYVDDDETIKVDVTAVDLPGYVTVKVNYFVLD